MDECDDGSGAGRSDDDSDNDSEHGDEGHVPERLPCGGAPSSSQPLEHRNLLPDDHATWLQNTHRRVGLRLGGSVMEGGAGGTKLRQFGVKSQDCLGAVARQRPKEKEG
ncbi:unnamed protein product [Ectocarpus sp. 4 AP-2014]